MSVFSPRYVFAILAGLLLVLAAALFHLQAAEAEAADTALSAPAVAVDVALVHERPVSEQHEYSGRLEAVDRVDIRPQVSGTITSVHFDDGALVNEGDVLFTIDPRPYRAAVARAQANLAAAQAHVAHTTSELARAKRLLAQNAVARKDFEEKRHAARVAAAQEQGAVAALAAAELDLEHTEILAPVSGRVSRAEVTEGNFVQAGAGSPPLTTLVSVNQLYASFDVDEQSFLNFVLPARMSSDTPSSVSMGLGNETGFPRTGRLASIDNQLDPASGTIRLRAIFDNSDGKLIPGLYARIRLTGGDPRNAVLIDETAIGIDQDKRFVLVVDENNHAAYREVTLGALQEGMRIVETGLHAGERIVVNGLQRVRPGEAVAAQTVSPSSTTQLAGAKPGPQLPRSSSQNAS